MRKNWNNAKEPVIAKMNWVYQLINYKIINNSLLFEFQWQILEETMVALTSTMTNNQFRKFISKFLEFEELFQKWWQIKKLSWSILRELLFVLTCQSWNYSVVSNV